MCCIALTLKSFTPNDFWVSGNGTSAQRRLMSGFEIKECKAILKLYKNFGQFHLKKNIEFKVSTSQF